jgi:DNA modification methylase
MLQYESIKGVYGEVRFIDCVAGMKEVSDHFDMCITDPPYNVEYVCFRENSKSYSDKMNSEEYLQFSFNWFSEVKRLSDFLIFTCGNSNVEMWYSIEYPFDKLIWVKRNSQSGSKVAKLCTHEEILIYGKPKNRYLWSTIDVNAKWGFIRDPKLNQLIHPTIKPVELWRYLITEQNPTSVLDCFCGSGVTPEVCEEYGIKYLCFEPDPKYKGDIAYRIQRGINRYKTHHKAKKLMEL